MRKMQPKSNTYQEQDSENKREHGLSVSFKTLETDSLHGALSEGSYICCTFDLPKHHILLKLSVGCSYFDNKVHYIYGLFVCGFVGCCFAKHPYCRDRGKPVSEDYICLLHTEVWNLHTLEVS